MAGFLSIDSVAGVKDALDIFATWVTGILMVRRLQGP